MPVAGRHIRHDWQTFVDWEQKSVRTACGRTTSRHLAGIPGVTHQPEIVNVAGSAMVGWCVPCSVKVNKRAESALISENFHPYIKPMYESVLEVVAPIYDAYRKRKEDTRKKREQMYTGPAPTPRPSGMDTRFF